MAIISDDGTKRRTLVIPFDEQKFVEVLRFTATADEATVGGAKIICVLEHVGGMPGQSAPAAFNFGSNFGFIRGVLTTTGIPYELVRPQKWKKEFSCTSDKNTAIAVAKRLFPGVNLRRTERCTKDHDGFAEALLMAEYARRRLT